MSEFHKLPSFGELERSKKWGFGDAFEILCNDAIVLAKSYIESGKLNDLSEGPMLVINSNIVVINKNDFLSFYRKNKNKLAQYLSYADIKTYQEEFLDRLASIKENYKGGRPPFPYKKMLNRQYKKF
jgi:hypothetical protein